MNVMRRSVTVSPAGTLDMLSQLEVAKLRDAGKGGLGERFGVWGRLRRNGGPESQTDYGVGPCGKAGIVRGKRGVARPGHAAISKLNSYRNHRIARLLG